MVTLETPVLSVAIDAVSKVDGEKALCGLITRAYFRLTSSSCHEGLILHSFSLSLDMYLHLHSLNVTIAFLTATRR